MQAMILTSICKFVTRSIWVSTLFLAISPKVMAVAAEPSFPEGFEVPKEEALAQDLGIPPKEFKARVEDFALALSQGSKSQALKRLCSKDEETCRLVQDFQNQAADAKRLRMRNRRRGPAVKVTAKNVQDLQRQEFQTVLSRVKVKDEYELFAAAEKSLKVVDCPHNLSAALAVKTEEYFPFPNARSLSKDLFEHARQCMSDTDAAYERLFLRQGLYAFYDGNKERAKELLLLANKAKTSSEGYRVLYWLGKLEQKEGEKDRPNEYWTQLMTQYPLSFYAIQAAASLKQDPMEMITQRKLGGIKREVANDPEMNRMIRWLEALYTLKKSSAVAKWASWIVRANEQEMDVDVLHYLSALKLASGMYRSSISMLFNYFKKYPQSLNQEGLKLLYPRPYYSLIEEASKGRIDTFLVLGLVRQESAFDPRAVSRAKAKGLMQIIPQTARRLASQGHKKLLNEKDNTQMGVKYLVQLGGRFEGSAELVLAAYNAGPQRVDEWLKRNPTRASNPLLWNDLIPYMETRDYVVSILRNNYLYARLYNESEQGPDNLHSVLVKELLALAAKK